MMTEEKKRPGRKPNPNRVKPVGVLVRLDPDVENRLQNMRYAKNCTLQGWLVTVINKALAKEEKDNGGPFPQRPEGD